MDVCRPPAVHEVAPRIRGRFDGAKVVVALRIRYRATAPAEIGVERRNVAIVLVAISSTRIGLPEFDQYVRHRSGVLVLDLAVYDDPLADGLAVLRIVEDKIVIERADVVVAKHRAGH